MSGGGRTSFERSKPWVHGVERTAPASREERPEDFLVRLYDNQLLKCGDTAMGALWPNDEDRITRFDVMLDVIEADQSGPIVLCDFGCGTGELLARIRARGLNQITYIGVDRSKVALEHARRKFPDARFLELDVNAPGADLDPLACDYLVADGVFTGKFELSYDEMLAFLTSSVEKLWPRVRRGLAFNVMSKVVDWERDDLFHLPMDEAARLLHRLAGRRIRFRADYGLYEYTAFAYKPASESRARADDKETPSGVAVLRPALPTADRLAPYLRRIDDSRIYSNRGPLVVELETRLAEHLAPKGGKVATASTGTAGLFGAILAVAGRATAEKPLALMPAFTFVATAVAAETCGYGIALADVNETDWMLDPDSLADHPDIDRVGVVIPVAPFGRPVPQAPWRAFKRRTGIPVVIDAAASFDRVIDAPERYTGDIPVVLSFHATKVFGAGEGGCVIAGSEGLGWDVTRALNFGFLVDRDSQTPSTNGKMSEYHAAVALAELDGWPRKRAAVEAVIEGYRRQMAAAGLSNRFVGAPDIGLSYALFLNADQADAHAVQAALTEAGVGMRLWYGLGLHRQTHIAEVSTPPPLPVTERIAPLLLGLPMAPDLSDAQVAVVVAALAKGSRSPG